MTLCALIIRFAFHSFLGWIFECLYCPFLDGKIANRGFLKGPYCPVYGLGATAIILALERVKSPAVIFFLGIVIAGGIEYFTGWLLETCFQDRWWDYSEMPFNIKGRVFLLGLIAFGVASVVGVKVIEPAFKRIISSVSPDALFFATGAFCAAILIDTASTLYRMLNRTPGAFLARASARFEKAKSIGGPVAVIQRAVDRIVFGKSKDGG